MNHNLIFSATFLSLIFCTATHQSIAEEAPKPSTHAHLQPLNAKDNPAEKWVHIGKENSWDLPPKVAKTDLDADLNYDGSLQGTDSGDDGIYESRAPGLVLGVGELTKVLIKVLPYDQPFPKGLAVGLEVDHINRDVSSGDFTSEQERQANAGAIRIWKDAERKELLLDSTNPSKRFIEWTSQFTAHPYNIPQDFPRVIYVEGVKRSPKHSGDLRILLTCFERGRPKLSKKDSDLALDDAIISQISFDHIVLTVNSTPHPKEFIHNNQEGVWISPAQ